MMAYQYVNRRGDVYHLQANAKRGGGVGYSFTCKKTPDKPVDEIPQGYEVYENPENSQVFLRKIVPSQILPQERQLVEDSMRSFTKVELFIVDVQGDSVVVYTADTSELDRMLEEFGAFGVLRGGSQRR